ncbi:hypothetical protein VTK73DRAFT_8405 [Phialemonium thermophilum]|uniref:Ca2+ regulator and membrane fusion protein Fig1-domain-containing protein n=1 Tax=Phialemonium thermophilum TaxID=223376 RepID=A0ABR3W8S0_9PEZI
MGVVQMIKGPLLPFLLAVPIVLFEALSLSGCVSTSPSLPDLYIVSFVRNTTTPPTELRFGYMGICGSDNHTLHCRASVGRSVDALFPSLFPDLNGTHTGKQKAAAAQRVADVKALLQTARTLQSKVFVPLLAGAGVFFLVGLLSLPLLRRITRHPEKAQRVGGKFRLVTQACLALSAVLAFTASLATSQAAGALQFSTLVSAPGTHIAARPGVALQVMQWLAFAFTLVFAAAVSWFARVDEKEWQ